MKRHNAVITSLLLLALAGALSPLLNTGALAAGVPTRNPHHPTGTPTETHTPTVVPSNTPSATATPSNTPSPTPTQTPTPHLLATATPSIIPTATPIGALPLCATHDVNQYHALIKADGSCHYNHEHHADPNDAASVALFGQAGDWFGGTSISYPWETQNPITGCFENDCKHNGYKWLVRHTLGIPSNAPGGIPDFREQVHFMATASDYVVRFHSFMLEARACRAGRCGTIRTGGYQDNGCLYTVPSGLLVPIPQNPTGCPATESGTNRRVHSSVQYLPAPNVYPQNAVWYGFNAIVSVALFTSSEFGAIDLDNPSAQTFICPALDCRANGSNLSPHFVILNIDAAVFAAYTVDGLVNFNGFTDVYGNVSSACTAASLSCVPLVIVGLPVGEYQYRDDVNGHGEDDYDTCRPLGQVCIAFPN